MDLRHMTLRRSNDSPPHGQPPPLPMDATWSLAVLVAWVLPTAAVTLPPIFYPHFLSFVVPLGVWAFLCFAFLCVNAVTTKSDTREAVAPATPASELPTKITETEAALPDLNVVFLDELVRALESQSPEAVLNMLYTGRDLLACVPADACKFAIISYKQVRSKDDA